MDIKTKLLQVPADRSMLRAARPRELNAAEFPFVSGMGMGECLDLLMSRGRQAKLSDETLVAYRRCWRGLIEWSNSRELAIPRLAGPEAEECFRYLTRGRGRSHHLQVRAALRFAFRELGAKDEFPDYVCPGLPQPNGPAVAISASELGQMFLALQEERNSYFGRLCFHFAHSLFLIGCRYGVLASLSRGALGWNENGEISMVRIRRNGSQIQVCAASAALGEAIGQWLRFLDNFKGLRVRQKVGVTFAKSDLVFPGKKGTPVSNQAFNAHLRDACRRAGVPVVTAQGIRATAATLLLRLDDLRRMNVQLGFQKWDAPSGEIPTHNNKGGADL